jgi:hypothetical protein
VAASVNRIICDPVVYNPRVMSGSIDRRCSESESLRIEADHKHHANKANNVRWMWRPRRHEGVVKVQPSAGLLPRQLAIN